MTCCGCGYQFCWLCGGIYTASHFSVGKCSGLLFAKEIPPPIQLKKTIARQIKSKRKLFKLPQLFTRKRKATVATVITHNSLRPVGTQEISMLVCGITNIGKSPVVTRYIDGYYDDVCLFLRPAHFS